MVRNIPHQRRCGRLAACLLCLLLAGLLLASAAAAQVTDRIVAVVNGEIITLYDLNKRFAPLMRQDKDKAPDLTDTERLQTMKRQMLDRMVDDILLYQEAKRLHAEASDADVESRLKAILQNNKMTPEKFQEELAKQGLTRTDYVKLLKQEISINNLLGYMVRDKVVVSDDEIEAYYRAHAQDYGSDRRVALHLIILPANMDPQKLRSKIEDKDLTFEEAAQKYSQGPGADSGGDMGTLGWDQLAPAWRKVLASLKPGDVSQPFEISGQQALLKLVADTAGSSKPLPEVASKIREFLAKPKYEQIYNDYVAKLRSKALIEMKY
ncbi:SurA N-terminal domain-containing protein [Desulfovibrio sp. X2]|uniref:SurA N-terminal domain-containing protein n=1 Tax=Desulfovibrio sp. X2 TaxID=941449 RepID=UPI0003FC3C3E|nr:SurA N-terminal domain-containing protein [Desulfovibrio sp. X2]